MRSVVAKRRRIAVAACSLFGLALSGMTLHARPVPTGTLTLEGAAVAGAPVYFSGTGIPDSTGRIVVIPVSPLIFAVSTPQIVSLPCYLGTPTALGTADVTTDSLGNIGSTLVWTNATPGSYSALLLQGTCASGVTGGLSPLPVSDQQIMASQDFAVGYGTPTLSPWGFAALGLALAIAGWGYLRTRS
ncbi:MAG: IPTL-CTERM sorting domain-containing protein [Thermoanaerobaculia bacterium]